MKTKMNSAPAVAAMTTTTTTKMKMPKRKKMEMMMKMKMKLLSACASASHCLSTCSVTAPRTSSTATGRAPCAWCGEVANSMCTACEQPLCTLAARGSRSGRDCHALYHEPLCVGLAKADVVKKRNAGGKGKEFSKPTVSQIKRYARKKQRDLEGDE